MKRQNAQGEVISAQNSESITAYDQALDLFNSFRMDPLAVITPAVTQDPEFISGHLFLAGAFLGAFDPQFFPLARASLDAAAAIKNVATERESSLYAALRTWSDKGTDAGNRLFDRHLVDHPRDLFSLQLAHQGDLVLGRTTMLRDRIEAALPAWSENDVGYGYVMGMHAFGLEECFTYGRAEDVGRRAVALQPHDAWAVHAVAHVHEMQGRPRDGIDWMNATRKDWQTNNAMAVHNHWHLALMHLSQDNHAAALELYDEAISPSDQSITLNLNDASALLWRLYLRGVDVGSRWKVLAARLKAHSLPGNFAFNDIHAAIAFAAAGDEASLAHMRAEVAKAGEAADGGMPWRDIAVPVTQAVSALVNGHAGLSANLLLNVLPVSQAMGGSHAQRDLLVLTTQEAARRSADNRLVTAMGTLRQKHHHAAVHLLGAQRGFRARESLKLAA
jgi:tetratricopeptide (TPR) repeat protein